MALVQYSDSESEDDVAPPPAKKPFLKQSASLPPLPAAFHDLYASNARISVQDDPALHGGRKRAVPHIEGNWPTHLSLEWTPSKDDIKLLQKLLPKSPDKIKDTSTPQIHSLLHSDLGAQLPLHISLSRAVALRTEQRASFAQALTRSIQNSNIPKFEVTFDSLKWVSNFNETRWFLVLHVQQPEGDELNGLINLSNKVMAKFDQPPLYIPKDGNQSPRDFTDNFHVSIAWSLTKPSDDYLLQASDPDFERVKAIRIRFDSVKSKVGNVVSSLPLKTDPLDLRTRDNNTVLIMNYDDQ